jgi:hypothetical protein
MKKLAMLIGFVVGGVAMLGRAQGQPSEPAPEVTGAAGAPAEESYLPGPGGGELEQDGPPPLESTGLEDGIGSCKCATALGAGGNSLAPFFAVAAGLTLLSRRRRPAISRTR